MWFCKQDVCTQTQSQKINWFANGLNSANLSENLEECNDLHSMGDKLNLCFVPADSVSIFTVALLTPGTSSTQRSTLETQLAHVIPPMSNTRCHPSLNFRAMMITDHTVTIGPAVRVSQHDRLTAGIYAHFNRPTCSETRGISTL